MTRYLLITLLIFIFLSCRKSPSQVPETYSPCANSLPSAGDFLPASEIMHIADKYVTEGLPGITFMARKGNQYWHYNAGSYNTEAKLPMKSCIIWPGYSISKMYTASVILLMAERNQLNLDQKLNTCLPGNITSLVPGVEKISIRMLLNHSSGVENFWENTEFRAAYIADPARIYTFRDCLQAAQGRLFEPGTDVSYSNTNYLLLSLIIDHINKQSHEKAIQTYIFNNLQLSNSFYKKLPVERRENFPELYADVTTSGDLINYTDLSLLQFANESGSNSIMASPKDFVDFMQALTHGKLITSSALIEMKQQYRGKSSADVYGLGFEFFEKNGKWLYGHSGSSFGGRTLLLYNPQTDISFFIGVNAGAELGGPVLEKAAGLMDEIINQMSL